MSLENIKVGMKFEQTFTVTTDDTADKFGNDKVPVFASPRLISWIEGTCIQTVKPELEADMETVGTTFNMQHLAATPVGMTVKVIATVSEVKGKMLTFSVEAFDDKDKICEGTHGRAIIGLEKFLSRVEQKANA